MICQTLGDSPFTVITLYQIRQGNVNMVLIGTPSHIKGLVVQSHQLLEEPNAFGTDTNAIIQCLQEISGWTCVNVASDIADDLSGIMQNTLERSIRPYGDVYYVQETPISEPDTDINGVELRFLTKADIGTLENVRADLLTSSIGDYVAGGIVNNRMIAISHASAISDTYADVGVFTDEEWRNRGISTYLSRLVMRKLQHTGYTPVWSTGEDNVESQRVAEKLGMKFYGSRQYLIIN